MYFGGPLTMPCTRSTRAAASDSCSVRTTGTTPTKAPSKRSCTPCSRALAHSSSPCCDRSCLMAETTWRPDRIAPSTYERAGSIPPISSTIRSAPSRISSNEPRERVSTPDSTGRSPVTGTIASARSSSRCANADPTVPWPSRPTLNVSGTQVLEGLAAHDAARVAARAEDHRRPRNAVVVVGHRVPVGARDRCDDDVAGPRVGQVRVLDQHITGLAVLPHQGARLAALVHAVDGGRLVARAVEHWAQVVGHPAVD